MRKLIYALGGLLCSILTASAADLPLKAPVLIDNCTFTSCSGWYVGGSLIGSGTSQDITGAGINPSVFSAGGMIGLDAGYQLWNGNLFAAVEVAAYYDVTGGLAVSAPARQRYMGLQLFKVGYGMSGLFGSPGQTTPSQAPTTLTIPSALAAALLSPYAQVGAVERPWGTGWAVGAGMDFIVARGWNLDVSYLRVNYGAGDAVNPLQVVKSEDFVKLSLNRKF